ncbi:MAG: Spy/CpxP family protein refolding chaperone [Gammaproteobacteria bacterium]|nr:Spy/CpxP family protein refolding chaperone [Gammaproteobacteria bacterium]
MRTIGNLFAAAAVAGLALAGASAPRSALAAADQAAPPPPPPPMHCPMYDHEQGPWGHGPHGWMHRHGGFMGGPGFWMHALDLTGAQRQSVQAILESARVDFRDLHEKMRADAGKLRASNPDDPGHAALVATVSREDGELFARMVTTREEVRGKLYALLTPAQKAALAKMRGRMQQGRGCDCGGGRFGGDHR